MTTQTAEVESGIRRALPDPGERVPLIALPTVAVFLGSLATFVVSTVLAVGHDVPRAVTIAVDAVVCFVMFTVSHDASHYSISRVRWVNALLGRLSFLFVSPLLSFPAFAFCHIEHHRHANDGAHDPDSFATQGHGLSLAVHWAAMDAAYAPFYARRVASRPRAEVLETLGLIVLTLSGAVAAVATGSVWLVLVVYVIPERIAIFFLAWWFDWLPHHGLEDTQRENRYRATRNRVGMEWLFTPLMLSQNYHLVHHLHPSIPFYRYLRAWRRNEEAYLEHDAAISTVFGHSLSPTEFREWKALNRQLYRVLPVRMPAGSSSRFGEFHRLPVASIDPITSDAVMVTFAVPEAKSDLFAFAPGQHVTVRTDLGGEGVRRSYSICAPATRATLRIAVKRLPGGAFSSFVHERLAPGDVLEVMTPTGRFCPPLDPDAAREYVGVAAGSGITPILSVLETVLEVEPESRFTLVYGNRTRETTMFRAELDALEQRFADRLEVIHVLSREAGAGSELRGRIDRAKLERWLGDRLPRDAVWLICGPMEMSVEVREAVLAGGVAADRIHLELFHGFGTAGERRGEVGAPAAEVTMTLSGRAETFTLAPGESLLEGALQRRPDTPYACMGGACGSCRARVVSGSVAMDQNFALGADDVAAGWVLTCQAHPTSESVVIDYDA